MTAIHIKARDTGRGEVWVEIHGGKTADVLREHVFEYPYLFTDRADEFSKNYIKTVQDQACERAAALAKNYACDWSKEGF
jgi:predicted RecA/RadA family phage recombinase